MTGWWEGFDRFLATDPRDVGCDGAMAVLHVYVELLAAGVDAAEHYPGLASHLAACGSCAADARGLLGLCTDTICVSEAGSSRLPVARRQNRLYERDFALDAVVPQLLFDLRGKTSRSAVTKRW